MADALEIDSLARGGNKESVHFAGKDWLWQQDLSNGSYSTQVQIDTSSLSSGNQKVVFSEAFWSVPYTITITGQTANVAGAVCWKSGYNSLVDSCQITFNNKTANNLCTKTNQYITIRNELEMAPDKLQTSAPFYGVTKDNPFSIVYDTTNNTVYNNNISNLYTAVVPTGAYSSLFSTCNNGLLQRCQYQCIQANNTISSSNLTSAFQPISSFASNIQTISGIAIIKLSDISNLFREMNFPVSGLRLFLQINVNTGQFTITKSSQATSGSTFPNQTIPIVVTSAGVSNMAGTTSTVTLAIGTYNGSSMSTRLYYPVVQLDPAMEKQLIKYPMKRTVNYRDIQFYQNLNISANTNFAWNVGNGIPGLRRIFIMPLIAQSLLSGNGNTPSWGSAVSSVPGTSDPWIGLSNISVQVNSRQIWSNNILYSYETFAEQVNANKLNGDTDLVFANSIFSWPEWLAGYRYYVFDLSKLAAKEIPDFNAPISLQVNATNNSAVAIDLFAWVEVETNVNLETTPSATVVT